MAKRHFLLLYLLLSGLFGVTYLNAAEHPLAEGVDFAGATVTATIKPTTYVPVVTVKQPANFVKIAGKTLNIVNVNSTTIDAGTHVNRYGDKFLYGHNSAAVFGGLKNLSVGNIFSVTQNGKTTNYRIAKIVTFEKNGSKLQLNSAGSYMNAVASAKFQGKNYALSIMTCAGKSYGNGDASHRLVIFADQI